MVDQYKQRNEFDKIDKHIALVRTSVHHLTGILNYFLLLGKLEAGEVEVVYEKINLYGLFQDIIEEIKPSLKEGQYILLNCRRKIQLHPTHAFSGIFCST